MRKKPVVRRRRAGERPDRSSGFDLARSLRSLAGGLAKGLDIESVLHEILINCQKALAVPRGAAYMLEADSRCMLRSHFGFRESARNRLVDFFGHAEWLRSVIERSQPVVVSSVSEESTSAENALLRGAGARSLLVVPLTLGKDRLGGLVFFSPQASLEKEVGLFTPEVQAELGQATALARAIASSITSEQRFRDLVQGLDAIVWEAEADTFQFTFVSQKAEDVLGYPVERWLHEKDFWINRVHPEDRKQAVAFCRKAVREGKNHEFEYRALAADGRTVWMRDIVRVVWDLEGEVLHLRGLMVDITERRRAELKLEERSTYLNALIENSPLAIVVLDPEHKVKMCNPAFEQLFGYRQAEMEGSDLDEFIAPGEKAEEAAEFTRKILAGETLHATTQRSRKDGSLAEVEVFGVPLLADKRLIGVYAIYQDVTERQRAERALRQSEERFSRIFRSSPDAISISSLKDGRYLEVNDGFLRLSGHRRDEIIGRTSLELGIWSDPADRLKLLSTLSKKGRVKDSEFRFRTRAGEERSGLMSADIIELAGEPYLLAVIRDITERIQAEAAMRESEARYRLLFDANPHPMWVHDLETLSFLAVNDAAERHYGFSHDEFLVMNVKDICPPEEIPGLLARIAEPPTGPTQPAIVRHRKRDGTLIDVEIVSHTVEFAGRRARLVLATDVTERRRAEQLQQAVYQIARAADTAETLAAFFQQIHEVIGTVMPARNFYISLYDDGTDMLSFPYFVDEVDVPLPPQKPGHGLTAYVLRTGKSLLCDLKTHEALEKQGEIELVGEQSPIWLGVPLRAGDKTFGAMVVQHYSDPAAYGEREKAILEYVSSQLSLMIERKRAEEGLRESEAKFRALTETASSAILISRGDVFLYANPAAEGMLGYSSGELVGRNFWDTVHPEFRELVRTRREARLQGKAVPSRYEFKVVTKGGQQRWIDFTAAVIDFGGSPAVLGTAFDITERVEAEKRLQESEANYRSLVDGAPYGIYRADHADRFLSVNPALVQMLGYPSEADLLLASLSADVYRDPEELEEFKRNCWGRERFEAVEADWKRKDGAPIIVRLGGRTVQDEKSRLAYMEVMAEDVTERRTLEKQLQQAHKMEAVGRLAGGIAHDFNNLLMVIRGHSELLRQRLGLENPSRASVSEIEKASDRAASLTQQLLAFSRKQMIQPRVLDLNDVLADMESMLRRLIGEQIELITVSRPDLGRIRADQGQIEQILLNLVINARDAMPQGGKLIIETGDAELDEAYVRSHQGARAGSYIMLVVSDTGMGMDKETQSQIFEPFFTTKEMGKGTGMGLSTVYGIVKQSDGYIAVYSEVRQGSTFKVYFPRVDAKPEIISAPEPSARAAGGTETILLVEDEEPLRRLVSDYLEGNGYRVLAAASGREAIQLVDAHPGKIDLLVTDVVMPGMSGRDLVERLSAARPDLKTVYMSGYTDEAIAQHGVLEPGIILLQKPFTLSSLTQKLREVLEGNTAESPR